MVSSLIEKQYWLCILTLFAVFTQGNSSTSSCQLEDPGNTASQVFAIKVSETQVAPEVLMVLKAENVQNITVTMDIEGSTIEEHVQLKLIQGLLKIVLVKKFGEFLVETRNDYWAFNVKLKCGSENAEATIILEIIDENDHKPEFEAAAYSYTMPMNFPAGISMTCIEGNQPISATDKDMGKNQEIEFSLASEHKSNFEVRTAVDNDIYYAVLKLTQPLQTKVDKIQLEITAKDHGEDVLESTAVVNIALTPSDDRPPKFNSPMYTGQVRNPQIASEVEIVNGPIQAVDGDHDINAKIIYSLLDMEDGVFHLFRAQPTDNGKSIALHTTGGFPYEVLQQGKVALVVKASQEDNPNRVAYATVIISLPVPKMEFESPYYTATIKDPKHQGVVQVEPTIKLVGGDDSVKYSIVKDQAASPGSQYFEVKNINGDVALSVKDGETLNLDTIKGKVALLIEARQPSALMEHVARTVVTVYVPQDLTNPLFQQNSYKAQIDSHDFSGPLPVSPAIKAVDGDRLINRKINYTLAEASGDLSPYFSVKPGNSGTAEVTVLGLQGLDREDVTLLIKAEEVGAVQSYHRYSFALLTISLPPQDDFGTSTTQESTSTEGQSLSTTEQLTTAGPELTESSTSSSPVTSPTCPTCPSACPEADILFTSPLYEAHFPEEKMGHVLTVHATGSDVVYEITEAQPAGHFEIDESNGSITCISPVNYERHHQVTLKLMASWNSSSAAPTVDSTELACRNASLAVVVVSVLDENDNSPYFTTIDRDTNRYTVGYPLSAQIYQAVPMPVCRLQVEDDDSGLNGLVRYLPISNEKFFIDTVTGVVYSIGQLNCDPSCSFTIRARDTGGLETGNSAEVTVQVKLLSGEQISEITAANVTMEGKEKFASELSHLTNYTVRTLHIQPTQDFHSEYKSGSESGSSSDSYSGSESKSYSDSSSDSLANIPVITDSLKIWQRNVRLEDSRTGLKLYVYALDGETVVDHATFFEKLEDSLQQQGKVLADIGVTSLEGSGDLSAVTDDELAVFQITTVVMGITVLLLVAVCVAVSYIHIKRSLPKTGSKSRVSPSANGPSDITISKSTQNSYNGPDPNPDGDWCIPMDNSQDSTTINPDTARLLNGDDNVTMDAFRDGSDANLLFSTHNHADDTQATPKSETPSKNVSAVPRPRVANRPSSAPEAREIARTQPAEAGRRELNSLIVSTEEQWLGTGTQAVEPRAEREKKKSILKPESLDIDRLEKEESHDRKRSVVHFKESPTVIPTESLRDGLEADNVNTTAEYDPEKTTGDDSEPRTKDDSKIKTEDDPETTEEDDQEIMDEKL